MARVVLLMVWVAGAGLPAVSARQTAPREIREVQFSGLSGADAAWAREVARVSPGSPLNTDLLDIAVGRLLRSGRLVSVRYKLVDVAGGVRVVFEVRQRRMVRAIRFVGNVEFPDARLSDVVTQRVGEPIDWLSARGARDAIEAMYQEAGYGEVAVTYDAAAFEKTGTLTFTIEEGQRRRIRKILFEGHSAFDRRELIRHVESKPRFWIFRTGAFDSGQAEADAGSLQAFYRDEGFLDARVGFRTEPLADGEELAVVFVIQEGGRYRIESIEFLGQQAFSSESLLAMMASRVGGVVRRRQLEADARAIQSRYGQSGYIDARVRARRVFSITPGLVAVTIEIHEGEQFRVGRVVVRGNRRTRDKVVRRALNLYPPEDLFDLSEAREAQRRLVATRIFSSARVYAVGDTPGVRDVLMDVQEADKAGDFIFGAGVTSNAGLTGNIVLDLQNFDITRRPKTLRDLFRFRTYTGGGQQLRIDLQPGRNLNRFRINFTEPYLFDKPTRLDFSAFLFSRSRDGYDERRAAVSVSLGKRLERGRLRGWSAELALRVESASVRNVDLFAARKIRSDEGTHLLTSVKGALVRDRTDNRLVPTTGDRLRLGLQQFGLFGGDDVFARFTAGYTWYKTLSVDARERKGVLQLRLEGGAILGDAPVFERFFVGGTGSLRGFEFRGVGDRQGLDRNNIGSEFMILGGAEYSFPVIGENLRGVLFMDTGAVGNGGLRAALGGGIRFNLPILSRPLPFELLLAFPVSSDADDEEQVFSFQIGRIF